MKKRIFFLLVLLSLAVPTLSLAMTSGQLNIKREFGENKKMTKFSYVNDAGELTMADDKGYASIVYTYNNNKQIIKYAYLDASGQPVNNLEGYAVKKLSYHKRRLMETAYYDVDGHLAIGTEGYARQTISYISPRKIKKIVNYGTDGELLRSAALFAKYEVTYEQVSAIKRKVEEVYLDADGGLIAGPDGFARATYAYSTGEILKEAAYFDANGRSYFNAKVGYARMERTYRNKSLLLTEAYFDENGDPCMSSSGYASLEYTYETGNSKPIREMYYDENGDAILQSGGYYGKGVIKTGAYQKSTVYYGPDGERGSCTDGYSRVETKTNSHRRTL